MEKPYDERRLGRAVHDILRALLATKFRDYYSKLSSIVLVDSMHALSSSSIKGRYNFAYRFAPVFGPPKFAMVTIVIDNPVKPYVQVSSDVGSCFDEFAEVEIANKLFYTYYGYFDTDMVVRHIKKLRAPQYTAAETQYVLDDIYVTNNLNNLQVQRWPKENPTLKRLADKGAYDKIRSTLKKIVTDTIGGNFDYVIEWRFELEKTPLRASAQYKLCKDEHANMLHVVVIFKDEDLNLEVISVSAEDDRIREMASCLPHEIRKRFNPLFNEDEKEKKEMTAPEVKLSHRNERIRSTLTAIVEAATREILQEAPPSVREYIDNIARIEFDGISIEEAYDNKLTVAAKYKFVKKYGMAEIAEIGIWFEDEFLTVWKVRILTRPYYDTPCDYGCCFPRMLSEYITKIIERDFTRMVYVECASECLDGCLCKYYKDEKEKREMTVSEANYIYNVKMTSEMREACDKIAECAKQKEHRKVSYEIYKLKARLNAVYGTAAFNTAGENKRLSVKEIVINEPAMVVFWEDGTKTVVTAKDEAFDAEKGLAMAFAKKALGNNYAAGGRFKTKLKHAKWAPKKQEKKRDIFCEENIRDDAKEIMEGTKKPAKEKPITKTAWIKSMMEEGFTRAEATKAWEKKHPK